MATTFVPFDVSGLGGDNIRNVDLVRGKINEAVQAVNVRDAELMNFQAGIEVHAQKAQQLLRFAMHPCPVHSTGN